MDTITGINPLYAIGSNINVNRISTKKDVEREFVGIFISQVMGNVFKGQGSLFGSEGALGTYTDNLYNDIMLSKISREIAENKAFGFDKLLSLNDKVSDKW